MRAWLDHIQFLLAGGDPASDAWPGNLMTLLAKLPIAVVAADSGARNTASAAGCSAAAGVSAHDLVSSLFSILSSRSILFSLACMSEAAPSQARDALLAPDRRRSNWQVTHEDRGKHR